MGQCPCYAVFDEVSFVSMYYDCDPSHCKQFDYGINIMLVLCYVSNIVALIYCEAVAFRGCKSHINVHVYINRLRTLAF